VVDFNLQKVKAAQQEMQKAADAGAGPTKEMEKTMSAEQKAQFEKAKKERESQMAKNKALNDAFNAGREAMAANQWDTAVEQLQKASEMDANQHVVFANLADAYVGRAKAKSGADRDADVAKGIAAYQKAVELKPDDASYHNNYALALAQAKKFDDAQAELNKAAQLDPTQAGKFYYNLGALLTNAGQTEPATVAFKKAIETDPNYADAYYQYGICLMGKATVGEGGKMNAVPGTAEAFQKYLELAPTGVNAEPAKAMLQTIGATFETEFGTRKKTTPKKKN
jgi:tetratricopeptide (TPR) repeat protein